MKTKNITLIALLIALLSIFAQFSIPIGPVPITLQTFIVLLIGALLPPKDAFLTTTLYLIIGLFGLPVFAGFQGGPHAFLLPTFGFILSWIPATTFQALYLRKSMQTSKNYIISFIINYLVTYIIGLSYMSVILHNVMEMQLAIIDVLWIGFIPFIFGDFLKMSSALILVKRLKKYLNINE